MAKHNELGKWGENIAYEWLITKGYTICERNWRLGHYEIDIIAMKGNRLIIVEVKTRANDDVDPILAIDKNKIRRMVSSANAYISSHNLKHEVQFDIIAIVGDQQNYTVEHIEDAFMAPLYSR